MKGDTSGYFKIDDVGLFIISMGKLFLMFGISFFMIKHCKSILIADNSLMKHLIIPQISGRAALS